MEFNLKNVPLNLDVYGGNLDMWADGSVSYDFVKGKFIPALLTNSSNGKIFLIKVKDNYVEPDCYNYYKINADYHILH